MRARRFLEHLSTLAAAEWADVLRRAVLVDPEARRGALQHAGELLTMHTRRRACDALLRVAQDAVDSARDSGRLAVHDVQRAASLASGSALALVVRDRLLRQEFEALYAPFDTPIPCPQSAVEGPGLVRAGAATALGGRQTATFWSGSRPISSADPTSLTVTERRF